MFRLLKLAAYGLLGYAIYEFIRGAMNAEGGVMERAERGAESLSHGMNRIGEGVQRGVQRLSDTAENLTNQFQQSQGDQGQGGQGGGSSNMQDQAGRANMTGQGQGRVEETNDYAGESVPHAVGRGVVS